MTKRTLDIAADLALPVDAVTEPIGMFANRGKGKSNAAHRLVEQLYHAGLPAIVLDVKGDWYGIRSSANGTRPGLPFLIIGGSHGDMVLEPGSGVSWARFLAEQRIPTIVDLSDFSKTAARRWVMEFAEELYRVNTEALLLVVDEADVLIPQRLAAELMRLLGAMEDIAKRGRQRGLGILVISQRVADVNKSVTDLLETLFLFMVSGARNRKALLEWIDDHGDPEEAKKVIATLSSLEPGESWVWSPGWLRILQRFVWARIETFDSHATPKAGEVRRTIKTMADIDLSAVKDQMAETIERAKADDPKELRKRILELERALTAARDQRPEPEQIVETVEVKVPFVPPAVIDLLKEHRTALATMSERVSDAISATLDAAPAKAPSRPQPTRAVVREPTARPAPRSTRTAAPVITGNLPKGEGRVLTAVAQNGERGATREQLTVLTGYKRSSRDTYLQRLRERGYVTTAGNAVFATDDGVDALGGDFEPLPTGIALQDHWLSELPEGERRILAELIAAHPSGVPRDDLSESTGYKRSSRDTYLQRLRSRQLITTDTGEARAADILFD